MGRTIQQKHCLCRPNMAEEASQLLSDLANAERLMIVTLLHEAGEMHVNAIVEVLGANRASLSRQLARLRDQSIVTTRRKHNRIYYALNDSNAAALIKTIGHVMS